MRFSGKSSILAPVFTAFISMAAMADNAYWYLGGSIGIAWASGLDDLTQDDVVQAVEITGLPPEFTPSIKSTDSNSVYFDDFGDLDWKFYGGYQFNKYLGLEAMYTDLGNFDREATLTGAVGLFSPARMLEETEVDGFGLSLVASYTFSETFTIFGKAGVFSWESETSGDLGVQTGTVCALILCAPIADKASYTIDDNGTDPMYGLGVMFGGEGLGLRFEWERFTGLGHGFESETDMDLVTMGVEFRFGAGY